MIDDAPTLVSSHGSSDRGPVERFVRRWYRRLITPRVKDELKVQRLKLLWHGWGYAGLFTVRRLSLSTRLRLLRDFLRVDWRVRHAHTPAEIITICRVIAERDSRPGELVVEAGCWQGGSSAKLSLISKALGYRLRVFDSFQGVEAMTPLAQEHDFSGEYAAPEALVRDHISSYGALDVCTFERGWFADTLARTPVAEAVRVAYIDCDLAKGTREALAGVIPSLAPDGCVFSQDFHIPSVQRTLLDGATWTGFGRGMPRIVRHGRRLASIRFADTATTAQKAAVGRGRHKILQISNYPPPRAGWGVRVQFLKRWLEAEGHECIVLNVGKSRMIPSREYETVMSGRDYVTKVWRFSRRGFVVHAHVNGESPKGFVLTIAAELINLLWGHRCFLTFHAGADQLYFPLPKYRWLFPMYWLMFAVPRHVICNSSAVKNKIVEYGISASKVSPIQAFSSQYLEFTQVPLARETEEFFARFPHVLFTYIRIREGFYLDTLIEGFARLTQERQDAGLLICGLGGDREPEIWSDMVGRISAHRLESRVHCVDDLDHDEFLVALTRSAMYVRTPTSDGVASSVLESLAIRVPVLAAENGSRPAGVITYAATEPGDLARHAAAILADRAAIVANLPAVDIRDTLTEEARLLTAS